MSYQVIARKYRPQSFKDLTGQEHITRTLSHALDGGRLHHAYVFSGVRGTGKTTTARILAKGLNCQTGTTSQPCLLCPSCLEIASGYSMDVLEIDAASNTGVDNVREVIINNIALAPARDRFKVFVIDEVHMLSTSAFNALLKTLEEPPAHVIFILATTELHKVPETILSRCQQFEFRQIPASKIFIRLREIAQLESIAIDDEALREIARAGAGSLRDAQSAFDQVIAFSGNTISVEDVGNSLGLVSTDTLQQFVEALASQNLARLLELVEEVYSRGYDARNFTRELMGSFRHLLLIKSGVESGELRDVTDVEVASMERLAPLFSADDLVRCFRMLGVLEKEIKDSPQPRFQLEVGLIGIARLRRLRPIEEILARLEALEQRLVQNGGTFGRTGSSGESEPGSGQDRAPRSDRRVSSESAEASPATVMAGERDRRQPVPTPASRRDSGLEPPPSIRVEARPNSKLDRTPPAVRAHVPDDLAGSYPETEPVGLIDDEDDPGRLEASERLSLKRQVRSAPSLQLETSGGEIGAIFAELQHLNRGLIETALEGAQLEYQPGLLVVTFSSDDTFARRIRESAELFRTIGEKLFGTPLRVEVKLSGESVLNTSDHAHRLEVLRQQALENPVIKMILNQTRGEITNVTPARSDSSDR